MSEREKRGFRWAIDLGDRGKGRERERYIGGQSLPCLRNGLVTATECGHYEALQVSVTSWSDGGWA